MTCDGTPGGFDTVKLAGCKHPGGRCQIMCQAWESELTCVGEDSGRLVGGACVGKGTNHALGCCTGCCFCSMQQYTMHAHCQCIVDAAFAVIVPGHARPCAVRKERMAVIHIYMCMLLLALLASSPSELAALEQETAHTLSLRAGPTVMSTHWLPLL